MAKRTYVNLATTPVVASFCHLDKADVGRQYSDGKFKITLFLDPADPLIAEVFKPACEKAASSEWPEGPPPGFHNPLAPVERSTREEEIGKVKVTFKTSEAPRLTDAAGNALPADVIIRSGDLVRVAGAAAAYVAGSNCGVTFYLNAVRLIDKRAAGIDPFGDGEEGYVAPASAGPTEALPEGEFNF